MTSLRNIVKRVADAVSLLIVAPGAATCRIETAISPDAEMAFAFWGQCFALVPGPPGVAVRRAFYRLTLDECARSFFIGFGALFTHRCSVVEDDAYVGAYALIGSARLERGCLVGSRVSLLSGTSLHEFSEGRWLPTETGRREQIAIGAYSWIGEGAIVMADVGPGAMVAAGAVVSSPVPPRIVVAGNPARFVRRLAQDTALETTPGAVR